ncbi:response regulator transcription factor [Priestia aryabhattai]|uniref:response regulator transcription factor n=1 Tax=Priestia aryabhattai TaxID=412384 RepID=UPI0030CFDBEF
MIHILLADDDEHMRQLVRYYLQLEGYMVHEAKDGEEASGLLVKQHIHLAVVDIMMPHKDGYEVCEEIRSYYDFPIILLTAKDQLEDKEKGFLAGTDDYVTKPFEPKELIFRIKALLRRYEVVNEKMIVLNNTSIDRKSYEVHCSGRLFILPMKEFELLAQLANYPGRIFTREELIHLIWGADFNGDNRTIDVHVKRLRERFGHTDDFVITTVRGVGYKLEVTAK